MLLNLLIYKLFSRQSSNMLNQARLKVLKVREDHVRNVLEEARKRLGDITTDQRKYAEILKTLMLQALFQVLLYTTKNNLIVKFVYFVAHGASSCN